MAKRDRKVDYLAALVEHESVPLAMRALDPPATFRELAKWRQDRTFRKEEIALAGKQPIVLEMDAATQRIIYLDALWEYRGNTSNARELAGLKRADLTALRADPAFLEAEQEVFDKVVDKIQESALKGAEDGKDLGHTMKVLSKLRKEQWGEEPRKVEHQHRGMITVKPVTEQIAELEAEDGLDLLQPPD